MLYEIDQARYVKVSRNSVLKLLERAGVKPDKFTAHRDHSYSAKYRKRKGVLKPTEYEDLIEQASHHDIAIFKYPNRKVDKGWYVVLRFGFVAVDRLGIDGLSTSKSGQHGDLVALNQMVGATRDMKQLTQFAHELVEGDGEKSHILVALDELQKEVNLISTYLNDLLEAKE